MTPADCFCLDCRGPGYEAMKLREIKNGRLAMLAFIGFASQYLATGKVIVFTLTRSPNLRSPAIFDQHTYADLLSS